MTFKLIVQIIDMMIYLGYYVFIIIFTLKHRKDIYRAACGGNGMPQPNELVKLFSVYSLIIYSNEVIHSNVEFNLNFGGFLLACIGVANLGKFNIDKFRCPPTDNKPKEE